MVTKETKGEGGTMAEPEAEGWRWVAAATN
jgi:hypothetical protein